MFMPRLIAACAALLLLAAPATALAGAKCPVNNDQLVKALKGSVKA